MNKKIAFIVLLLLILGTSYFITPYYLQSQAVKQLTAYDITNVQIGKTHIGLNSVSFSNIRLSNDQTIKRIKVFSSIPTMFGFGTVKHIEIDTATIKTETSSLMRSLRESDALLLSGSLPAERVSFKNVTAHMPILSDDIAFLLNGELNQTDAQTIQIKSNIQSRDDKFTFDGDISGTLSERDKSTIDLTIKNISVDHKLASMDDGTGWLNITQSHDDSENTAPSVSGQIEMQRGSILSLPSKNMTAVIGEENENYVLILRAQAAEVDGVVLYSDVSFGGSSSDLNMQSTVNIKNTNAFATYLENLKGQPQSINAFKNIEGSNLTLRYLPERRFVDGPLPFSISAKDNDGTILDGTFLIYPSDMEVRGSAQANPKYTKDIQKLLSIADEKVSNDTLRLDGTISHFF